MDSKKMRRSDLFDIIGTIVGWLAFMAVAALIVTQFLFAIK